MGEKTFAQLPEESLFWQANEQSNSIAVLVQHLSGNMLSRWTDFLTTDGEKEWRKREEEFRPSLSTKAEVIEQWNKGWNCLYKALELLSDIDLEKEIFIRNMGAYRHRSNSPSISALCLSYWANCFCWQAHSERAMGNAIYSKRGL